MTAPATAARCFLAAVLFGLGLGPVYGFLRPLRPRYTAAADGLFLIAAFFAWLCHSFAVCGGDIRLG